MFLIENVVIILIVSLLLFALFTFLNILTFTKDFLTSIFLTIIFFDLFFRMPFKAVNQIYNDKEKIIQKIEKSKISPEFKEKLRKPLKSKIKLFMILYRSGGLSYTNLMVNIRERYTKEPFKVRIKVIHMNRKRFEQIYFNNIKKDISNIEFS